MSRLHTIDLHFRGIPQAVASYVIETKAGPVVVETGPESTFHALESGLAGLGYAPRDVRHVLVTHIHLDHAGAAWRLASEGATIHVHEFGAKHLIDPSRLLDSARRIYRERMEPLWGRVEPIDAARVNPLADGDRLDLDGLAIDVLETPGHARHHHAFVVKVDAHRAIFTGDAAACFIRAAPTYISLPTPPPEFDRDAWLVSLDRLAGLSADRLYPTHFGEVADPSGHLDRVRDAIIEHVERVRTLRAAGLDRAAMLVRYQDWMITEARRVGVPERLGEFYVKSALADMNLTGILRWMDQRESPTTTRT